jgi:SAM-dependent methyltransferase
MSATDWNKPSEPFADAIATYYEQLGHDRGEPAIQSTIATNTRLVPGRAETLLLLIRSLAGYPGIEGKRVLEAGSGFGALATYLAWSQWPAQLVAVDIREDFIAMAETASAPLGVAELDFRVDDMRTLSTVGDHEMDVVILNNALTYLTGPGDLERGLASIARVLSPDGLAVFFHANKWTWRAPFTNDPVVHLLPGPVARLVRGITGWNYDRTRLRLISPRQLRGACRQAGLTDIRAGVPGSRDVRVGFTRGASFYGATARLPAA